VPQQGATKVVGRRVGAYLIDLLVQLLLAAGAWFALTGRLDADTSRGGGFVIGGTRYAFTSSTNRAIWVALVVLFGLAIFVILPGLRGTSPGRAAVGVRVVRADGQPPGVARAFLRWVLWIFVDGFPFLFPGLVGFVVALATRGNQRVGDIAAGTWVVRADAVGRPIEELLPAEHASAGAHPAGWYADPSGQARLRWWDGSNWTDHTSA